MPDGDPNGRSTPTLWGAGTRQAFSWAGTAPSLQTNMRGIIVNRMKGPEPSAETLDALEAYVKSLGYPPEPQLELRWNSVGCGARRGQARIQRLRPGGLSGVPSSADLRQEGSGGGLLRGKFKVPSLRVVSLTAPYFHDGRFATLEQTVRFMWEFVQKAGTTEKLTENDLRDLVEYLRIL